MKFKHLDGLRGWAALSVLLYHYASAFYAPTVTSDSNVNHSQWVDLIHNTPLNLLLNGDLMVCVFFVLSGFVLSQKYFQSKLSSIVVSSAIRRYIRLAFPVLASMMIAYALLKLNLMYNSRSTISPWLDSYFNFIPHFWSALNQGIQGVFTTPVSSSSVTNSYNPVTWTMQLEFVGSFIIFGFLLLFGRLKNRWLMYFGMIIYFLQSYYLAFVLGLILSDLWASRPASISSKKLLSWVGLGLFIVGVTIGTALPNQTSQWYQWSVYIPLNTSATEILLHCIGGGLIVASVLIFKPLTKLLQTRVSVFLGSISYSLYLVHFLILSSYSLHLFIVLNRTHSHTASFVIMFIPSLILIIALSYVFTILVDNRALLLSRQFERLFRSNILPALMYVGWRSQSSEGHLPVRAKNQALPDIKR